CISSGGNIAAYRFTFGETAPHARITMGCAGQQDAGCIRARFHAKFQDAEGDVGPFANMEFSLIRASDGAVVYHGTTDEQDRTRWDHACRGEQVRLRIARID
ncbi:hypothetical protein, partial [Burkholderia ubonensis]|uniref:hypothetical protein n=1 Tax=Burkholderia ubonensis TaxID=101571 RepID=UPI0012FC5835